MIYFILWVVFLVVVIFSVPIASWLEKRKLRSAYQSEEESVDEEEELGEADMVEEPQPEAAVEGEDVEAVGGGEFAEFEEIS